MADFTEQRIRIVETRKDFEVSYRFLSPEEGGRKTGPPAQLYRSDWSYEGEEIRRDEIYMIWPIFLDEKGEIVQPNEFVASEGIAQMFIVVDERRAFHAARIRPGVRGYFMEGPHRVAEATVTKLLALADCSEGDATSN